MGTVKTCRLCLGVHQPGECLARPCNAGYLYIAPKKPVEPTPESLVVEPEPQPEQPQPELIWPEPQPESVAQPELIWPTAPEEFHDGICTEVDPRRGFIIIDWQGERILAHIKDIVTSGNHICVFRNAPVIFRIYHDPAKDRDVAADVNLNIAVDAVTEVELSTVVEDRGTWYVLARDCGCRIILPGFALDGSATIGTKVRHRHLEVDGRVTATAAEFAA